MFMDYVDVWHLVGFDQREGGVRSISLFRMFLQVGSISLPKPTASLGSSTLFFLTQDLVMALSLCPFMIRQHFYGFLAASVYGSIPCSLSHLCKQLPFSMFKLLYDSSLYPPTLISTIPLTLDQLGLSCCGSTYMCFFLISSTVMYVLFLMIAFNIFFFLAYFKKTVYNAYTKYVLIV